ncbi:MAG TPA: glycosyltransferase [Patescibacteria group bacterium]|nr:glycosyltransferase [Patescibacteria group bacterium]
MKTLIIANIVSSNLVHRLNTYIRNYKNDLGEVLVLFCGETESNRRWTLHEKIDFKYKILRNTKIEIGRSDLFTYFLNFSAWKEFENFSPDRIIVTGWSQFACQLSYLWAFLRRKKITLWSGSTSNEMTWRRFITLPMVWLMVKMSDAFIAYGVRAKKYLKNLGADPRKIEIFTNDVNGEYFRRESLKWKKKRLSTKRHFKIKTKHNFIYVGQLIERKGITKLIEAFDTFGSLNPDWGLVIVGYGDKENSIKNFIKSRRAENIYFLGNVEQYDLPRIYVACDCLILPSLEEVWGLVVNEALHCGLKVLVSEKCGCVPDLVRVGMNGYTFDPLKKKDLLNKIDKVSRLIGDRSQENPFFSIITCTKNSAKYLQKNIISVENQSYKNLEHIFVDGFSKDSTIRIIDRYRVRHPSMVKLFRTKPTGISNAMNTGINRARGKYILVLHSDDRLYGKNILKKVYTYLTAHPKFDWIYGKINVVEENGISIGKYPARKIYRFFPKYLLKFYNTVPHQAVFIKRSIFEKFGGFDETLTSVMDVDYWLKISDKTDWHFFDKIISDFMIRKTAQSSGLLNKSKNYSNAFRVRRRYMNGLELTIFKVIKMVTDPFSKTYR